jgi:hypothetical protein
MNDSLLGRVVALALILGVAYGVHSISRGGLGCPLGTGSCCATAIPHDEAPAAEKAVPAKLGADGDAGSDEEPKNVPAPAPAKDGE